MEPVEKGGGVLESAQPGVHLRRDAEYAPEALSHVPAAPTRSRPCSGSTRARPREASSWRRSQVTSDGSVGHGRGSEPDEPYEESERGEFTIEDVEAIGPRRRISQAIHHPAAVLTKTSSSGSAASFKQGDVATEQREAHRRA